MYAIGGGGTSAVTGTSGRIADLAADSTYTFTVTGSNAAGVGEAATINATTGTPGTVRALRVDGKSTTAVNLSWWPPSGGGTPTGYSVTGGGSAVVDGTRARIAGLAVDTAYTFTVSAVNAAGTGVGADIEVTTVDFTPTLPADSRPHGDGGCRARLCTARGRRGQPAAALCADRIAEHADVRRGRAHGKRHAGELGRGRPRADVHGDGQRRRHGRNEFHAHGPRRTWSRC